MSKLGLIAVLIAALAAPASAATQGARRAHQARARTSCPQAVVFLPGRSYGMCGNRYVVRNPETGTLEQVGFWTLQHLNDQHLADRP
jgi:hypothetical protein